MGEMAMKSPRENEVFKRGLEHFNAREFFEAHEVWEEIWLREPEPEKTFLQGLIQLAAAFHHYGRGNRRGAESLLAAGIIKLGRFPVDHRGFALDELRSQAREWAQMLGAGSDPGPRRLPRIRSVHKPK
jgi:predicted metal-dependent hydrolase